MPEYLSAAALIADARLRVDAFRGRLGVLVVEGPDDKRLFYARVQDPSQIVAAGGRTLLLSAYSLTTAEDQSRMIFLTDCDYAVRRGELSGGLPGLVITSGTTIESDIVDLDTLAPVVMEIVPSAVSSSQLSRICSEIVRLATLIALPIGRIRMAIQPYDVDVGLAVLDYSKYWLKMDGELNIEKLTVVVEEKLRREGVHVDLSDLISKTPPDDGMCNGKDLVRAIRFVLRAKYKVPNEVNVTVLGKMLRLAMTDSAFEGWAVVQRMRKWEAATGANILIRPRHPYHESDPV